MTIYTGLTGVNRLAPPQATGGAGAGSNQAENGITGITPAPSVTSLLNGQ